PGPGSDSLRCVGHVAFISEPALLRRQFMSTIIRNALVTGATSGIGQAIAETLAARGVRVVVSGRDAARGNEVVKTIRSRGGDARFLAADLATAAAASD